MAVVYLIKTPDIMLELISNIEQRAVDLLKISQRLNKLENEQTVH